MYPDYFQIYRGGLCSARKGISSSHLKLHKCNNCIHVEYILKNVAWRIRNTIIISDYAQSNLGPQDRIVHNLEVLGTRWKFTKQIGGPKQFAYP